MNYFLISVLLCVGSCLGDTVVKAGDDPNIDGVTVTDAPITEINRPSTPPTTVNPNITTPVPPSPNPNTTIPTPITTPTTNTTTTTTTQKPSPITTKITTTTPKPSPTTLIPNTTMVPATTMTPPHHDRKFDGPSFIGGIILALGMVAIGFVAFKFYKARTELNYHTL